MSDKKSTNAQKKEITAVFSTLSPEDYRRIAAEHLKRFEGYIPRIYSDPEGIPTMGAGIALFSKGKDNQFSLRDLGEIGREVNPSQPYTFSNKEKETLDSILNKINHMNDDSINRHETIRGIMDLIPSSTGSGDFEKDNKFGFTLSDDRIIEMAQEQWDAHNKVANERMIKIIKSNGWTEEDAKQFVESMQSSKEQAAFTSMAYNGLLAPKATRAWLAGDQATARLEVLYRSNANQLGGIASRRLAEANLLTGEPSTWSEKNRTLWEAIENSEEAKKYRAQYPKVFPDTSSSKPAPAQLNGDVQNTVNEKNKEQKENNYTVKEVPDKNRDAGLSVGPRSTLLTGLQGSPQSPGAQTFSDSTRILAALYPTMYPDYKPEPPPPRSRTEIDLEQQALKKLEALYPTMFQNETFT